MRARAGAVLEPSGKLLLPPGMQPILRNLSPPEILGVSHSRLVGLEPRLAVCTDEVPTLES